MPVFCKIEGHDQLVAPESPLAVKCGSVLRNLAMGLHGDSGRGAGSARKGLEAPHTIVKRVMHINARNSGSWAAGLPEAIAPVSVARLLFPASGSVPGKVMSGLELRSLSYRISF